ncbi:B12-binding domain-containing radical SAM protein, partial [Chloroflexota bacterium]
IVAGGPLFTAEHQSFDGIDHFVLNEAEYSLPPFIEDLKEGRAGPVYSTDRWPDIETTPVPAWDLLNMKKYVSMSVQYSRGCPFDCEFCDIVVLNGHTPRIKNRAQLLTELDALYNRGWRGDVFIVDDNFIGNKRKLKQEILPAIIQWMKLKRYPFALFTEASINLSDDEELMQLMVDANFNMVFIGIETPNEESLGECRKAQNMNRDLLASVKKLHNHGLQVQGGFIVGFDSDPHNIFENQINFIQKSGIVTAMVGLLSALPGTKLYHRLKKENRLLGEVSGNNTDCSINFVPKMSQETLIEGYRSIVSNIYSPKQYYERVKTFLTEYKPHHVSTSGLKLSHVRALLKSMWVLGLKEKGRRSYWKFLAWVLIKQPRSFPISINLAICGFHFRKVMESNNGY